MEVFAAHELTEHQPAQFRCSQSSRDTDARDQWTRRDTLLTSVTGGDVTNEGEQRGAVAPGRSRRGAQNRFSENMARLTSKSEYDRVWWIS